MPKHCRVPRRGKDVFSYLAGFRTARLAPTIREIQTHFGWKSRNSVVQVLKQLQRDGLTVRTKGQWRAAANEGVIEYGYARVPLFYVRDGAKLKLGDGNRILSRKIGFLDIDRRLFGRGRHIEVFAVQFDKMGSRWLNRMTLFIGCAAERSNPGWVIANVGGRTSVFYQRRKKDDPGWLQAGPFIDATEKTFPAETVSVIGKVVGMGSGRFVPGERANAATTK